MARITIELPDELAERLSARAAALATTAEEAAARIVMAGLRAAQDEDGDAEGPGKSDRRLRLIGLFPDGDLPPLEDLDRYLEDHWTGAIARDSGLASHP